MKNTLFIDVNHIKGFDFSPWGGIDGFLKATSHGAAGNNRGMMLKRVVPDLSKATNKTATAISSLPFSLSKGEELIDSSKDWKNVAGGMEDPLRTIYLLASALCGGAAYLKPMATSKMIIDLQYFAPHTITPQIDREGLQYFDRATDEGKTERIEPKDLIYFWLPDSDVEIGPALDNPLGVATIDAQIILGTSKTMLLYSERGWVPITVIGAKNMPNPAERQKAENFFTRLLRGGFDEDAKMINAEALSIERLGAGMDEIKDTYTQIKRESAEGVAKAFGIPSALMLSDNAFASEYKELRLDWYTTSQFRNIYHTIEGTLNKQLYTPRGYTWKFNIEELDIFQEDEAERAESLSSFVTAFTTDPDVALAGMELLGYDYSEEQKEGLDKLAVEKKAEKEEAKKVAEEQFELGRQDKKEQMDTRWGNRNEDKKPKDKKPKPFQRKAMTPDEIKDIALWYSKAKAWHLKGKGNAVDWECKHLSEEIAAPIRLKLSAAENELDIVKAFELGETETEAP